MFYFEIYKNYFSGVVVFNDRGLIYLVGFRDGSREFFEIIKFLNVKCTCVRTCYKLLLDRSLGYMVGL